MKDIEIIVEAENAQEVLEALKAKGIEHRSIKDIEAVARMEAPSKTRKPCCGNSENQSPSMIKKAQNYAKTMARWVKAGMPEVRIDEFRDRLSICAECDSLKGYECTECGCPMDIKAKMGIDKLCELSKW